MRSFLFVAVVMLATPLAATGQGWIGPAATIRVVERLDRSSRQATRFVVEDLTPAEILRLQVELDEAGYDPRSRSGVLDERTRNALSRFQASRGLEVCGCVSYETVVALGISPHVVARIDDDDSSSWAYRGGEPVVIYVPGHRSRDHRYIGPGVVVGHQPAVGAGQFRHRFPSRPERVGPTRRGSSRPIPPAPPRAGSRIRGGERDGGSRSAPPRP